MDYREERFDKFGFESPFVSGEEAFDSERALENGVGLEASNGSSSFGDDRERYGEEALSWLDLEDEASENLLFDEEGEDEWEEASSPRPAPAPFLGGRIWSSSDAKLGMKHAIFVSPAAVGQARAEVLFYVHGLLRPCGGLPAGGVAAFVKEDKFALGASVAASGRPIILVVPQFQVASDKKWSTRGLEQPTALNSYLERCLAEVGSVLGRAAPEVSGLIVAGHSRAYGVLNPLAASHASPAMNQGPLASLSGMWFLDSSYGSFPAGALARLLKAKPGLSVRQVYIAGSKTDLFGRKSRTGRLAYMPVSPRLSSHCQIPAKTLPDLLADRPLTVAYKPVAKRKKFAPDFAREAEEEWKFEHELKDELENEFEDEDEEWAEGFDEDENEDEGFDEAAAYESEDEAERRCGQDEALLEGIEPFMESENWSNSTEQVAFRERVLAEHIKRTEKRKKMKAQPDLRDDQLATITGTKIATRADTAAAAGKLLAAANAALAVAQQAGDVAAAKIRKISVTSGYRSASRQLRLWRGVFSAEGGYYDSTEATRQALPGGPHSEAAIAYLLKPTDSGGFGLGGRIAAPGFSNHQSGTALDFLVNLNKGGSIKLSSKDRYRSIWRASWFHKWMKANALTFGFHPIPTEEWHWEYRPGGTQTERFDALDADEAFDAEQELYDYSGEGEFMSLDENFDPESEDESWEADEVTLREMFETTVNFLDLAPEPFRVRGGLYAADEKKKAAQHQSGLIRTTSVIGAQEQKLAGLAPMPIEIGKELALWEDRKLGIWVSKYNRFTHYFGEAVRGIGRLRDLLSAGAGKVPSNLTPLQKRALRPTDDFYSSRGKKPAFSLWRTSATEYRTAVIGVAKALQDLEVQRRIFWAARGNLLVAIAEGKQLTKPEFEALEIELGDVVSIATADSIPILALGAAPAAAVAVVVALLGDLLFSAKKKREEYEQKLKAFKAKVKISNENIKIKLAEVDIAGSQFWTARAAVLAATTSREKARAKAREDAGNFGQALSKGISSGRSLAEIRMPILVTNAWWDLAFAALRAKRLAVENLDYLRNNGDLFDKATFIFDRPKANSTAHDDIRKISRAAKTLKEARMIITDEDVTEWIKINNLWDTFFANYYR